MTRKEQEYLAAVQRFEIHQTQGGELEAEYKEAKTLFCSPVHSVPHSKNGSDEEGRDGERSSVID